VSVFLLLNICLYVLSVAVSVAVGVVVVVVVVVVVGHWLFKKLLPPACCET